LQHSISPRGLVRSGLFSLDSGWMNP